MEDRHPRGVFEPEFTGAGGYSMFIAVDSDGRLVAHVSVLCPNKRRETYREFRALLDTIDPTAKLTLLR